MGLQLLIDLDNTPTSQLQGAIQLMQQAIAERGQPVQTPAPITAVVPTTSLLTDPEADAVARSLFGKPANVPVGTQTAPLAPAAPIAPIATAPAISTAMPTLAPAAVLSTDLDKEFLPWDGRIHTDAKTKCKTGEWKKKRGLNDAVLAQVVAELRLSYPLPASMTHTPPAQTTFVAPPAPATAPPAPVTPQPASAPPAPIANAVPPGPNAGALTFKDVMAKVGQHVNAGRITNAQVPGIVFKATGGALAGAQQLLSKPEWCPAVIAALDAAAASLVET